MTVAPDRPPDAPERKRPGRLRTAAERLRSGLDSVGSEPDPRFTFANERTFLAWARTGLALIGGGLAAEQVLHFNLGGIHLLVALPAIVLGGVIGIVAYRRWVENERAMRLGEPLGYSGLTAVLAYGVALLAAIGCVLVIIKALT
jgi:putative membrane protein